MSDIAVIAQIWRYLLYIIIPILAFYIIYLIITRAFKDMGFSSIEAIIIVFISALFGFIEIIIYGVNISNIYLFTHNNWIISINTGGALIPILLSFYLIIKNNLSGKKIIIGILVVTVITFFVTYPDPAKGIVSRFPFWLLPVFCASIISLLLYHNNYSKAAPFAYISGTIGVLIGADFFHLPTLVGSGVEPAKQAVIGGANVFDMVFITGILAVILDGVLMYRQKQQTTGVSQNW
jgi:uncharacterized membrane protein